MSLYIFLLFVHIFSAILGFVPGFVMIYILTIAQTLPQMKHVYAICKKIYVFVMVDGTLLLLTALVIGMLNPNLFTQIWYIVSLVLYFIALAAGPVVLSTKSKPVKKLLEESSGEDIPAEYFPLAREVFFYERITNVIFLIIIALMILKPF